LQLNGCDFVLAEQPTRGLSYRATKVTHYFHNSGRK
jgi:hypothetical protein